MLGLCAALSAILATARVAHCASAAPFFLVATPDLADRFFAQSVILMLPPTGTPLVVGIIVNKPTTTPVRKVFPRAATLQAPAQMAYFGGPVAVTEPWLVVRASGLAGKATRLLDDIYLETDPDSIAHILKAPGPLKDLRVFLGRAQWSQDQLQGEILERSWYRVRARPDLVFSSDPRRLWRMLVERAQLEEAGARPAQEPNPFALLRCGGGWPGWPAPYPLLSMLPDRRAAQH